MELLYVEFLLLTKGQSIFSTHTHTLSAHTLKPTTFLMLSGNHSN